MKTLKLMAIAFALIATVSCKKEQNEAKTVVVDTVEEVVEKATIDASNLATSTFKIDGMTCAMGCAAKIEKSLSKMDGVSSAKVNFENKTATVSYDVNKVTVDLLAAKVTANGDQYKASFSKSCSAKKCDTKCSADCKDVNCVKCAAKKAACKVKCDANKAKSCSAKKCDTKCSADCKDVNCVKCAAKKAACKVKCDAKKATCEKDCTKACCAKKDA